MLLPDPGRTLNTALAALAAAAAFAGEEPAVPSINDLLAQQRYEEALEPLRALEAEWSAALRKDDSLEYRLGWARALLALGMVEDRLARWQDALAHLERALELAEESESGPHFRGDCLDALGKVRHHAGRYEAAEAAFKAAIAQRREPEPGAREPWLSASRDHLGLLYLTMGRYREAGRLFHQSLRASGDDPALLAQRHGYLGRYYHTLRSYAAARSHFERAIEFAGEAWDRRHPSTISLVGQLGLTCLRLGDIEPARAALSEAAALMRERPPSRHASLILAACLNNLGQLALFEGEFEEARRIFSESLEDLTPLLGEHSAALAPFWNNHGYACQRLGRFPDAAQSFRRAVALYRSAVGAGHQRYIEARKNLALNLLLEGSAEEDAADQIRATATEALDVLGRLLTFGTERQRLNYLQRVDLLSLPCSLGADAGFLANLLLRTKARLLDSLLAEQDAAGELWQDLRASQRQRDDLLFATGDRDRLMELQSKIEALEQEIQKKTSGDAARRDSAADWTAVRETLPPRSAVVDFVRYRNYRAGSEGPAHYGAILLVPDGPPRWIPLAAEAQLETWLRVFNERLGYRAAVLAGRDASPPPLRLEAALRGLHDHFWAPIGSALPPETETLGISPDGLLNFVSFAVLLDDERRFLASRYRQMVYLASARDLLVDRNDPPLSRGPWTIAAVARFEPPSAPGDDAHATLVDRAVLDAIRDLQPVPGALEELHRLRKIVPPEALGETIANPTERELRDLAAGPLVLHLTTHGFFLHGADADPLSDAVQDFDREPERLYRAGILLTEAKRALSERVNGADIPFDEDGVLFPQEAAALPLATTRLVTLSSCQSALGEHLAGEGVLGLRRGFTLAGAGNVLLTLWPIPDDSTPAFMARTYSQALASDRLAQSLWDAQRRALEKPPSDDPDAIEETVLRYGGFVLSQRGPLLAAVELPPIDKPLNPGWIALAGATAIFAIVFLWPRRTRKLAE